ncbi:MAG: keto-deoxy-phosphogluconate aldolase, partial [Gammaproteobacteria bacterium]|nr:keto-deoxy-phosphogluconate aldolase [Gammaproteobacteria bacterium]
MKSDDRELDLRTELTRMPLLPVLVLDDVAQAERMVRCLLDQDVGVAEITLRTARALVILTHLSLHYPALTVGAGTV